MRLRILSLAEADLLEGFRFYERQGGVGCIFSNPSIQILSRFVSTRAFTGRFSAIIECSPSDFLLPCTMTCAKMRLEFGVSWIADEIGVGSSVG